MTKEISRAEFLGMAALTIGSLFGLGTIIRLITGKSMTGSKAESGYSAHDYGR